MKEQTAKIKPMPTKLKSSKKKNVCLLQKPNVQNLNKENIEVIWKNKKNLCQNFGDVEMTLCNNFQFD